ncbi:MAG: glycoside hydrolase family 3 protein [Candidatus Eisenbacteria sp.]|nr:glycoside hydrolase family 3 protein [Candidatus Eisenbacteria bacterium]
MADLGLKRAVGQLMVIGLPAGPLTPRRERRFCDLAPAGVILFRRNAHSVDAVSETTKRLQALAEEGGFSPLLICADEEGGFLSPILGLENPAPAAMALGTIGSESVAFEVAREVGSRLRTLGLNLNLAPCLDVNDEIANPVIGPRSFGDDPALVTRLGVSTVRGLKAGGVAATAKHFPGHGSTTLDSHKMLPVDTRSTEEIRASSLPPFVSAIEGGVDLVMTAHVAFPSVTGREAEPATFSSRIIEGLLRNELGFTGPVITDALEMAAVAGRASSGDAALRSLGAGADLLLFTGGDEKPWEARDVLLGAITDGRLAESRVRESLARIRVLRSQIPGLSLPQGDDLFAGPRERGIAVLEDPDGLIPIALDPEESLAVLVPDPGIPEGSVDCDLLERELVSRHPSIRLIRARAPEAVDPEPFRACDLALVFTLSRGPLDSWQERVVIEACESAPKVIVVAAFNPNAFPPPGRSMTRVATYDFSGPATEALVGRLFGRHKGSFDP